MTSTPKPPVLRMVFGTRHLRRNQPVEKNSEKAKKTP
jgi:hypothetical protein